MNIQAIKLELMERLLHTEEESLLIKIQALFQEKDLNEDANIDLPEWQIKETLKRKENLKKYPELTEEFDEVMERLKNKYDL